MTVRKALDGLGLCHGPRIAAADPGLRSVDGSDPCVRHTSHGTGTVGMCTAIPPSRGVAPGPAVPCGKAKGEAERGRPERLLDHA